MKQKEKQHLLALKAARARAQAPEQKRLAVDSACGRPAELQAMAAASDTISLFRRSTDAGVTCPASMTLDEDERDAIFGADTSDMILRRVSTSSNETQDGFYRDLMGYDRCISKRDLLAYLSRDGNREIFALFAAAADNRQDGRLGPDEIVAIMGMCKHYVETYAAYGLSVDFQTAILGPLALQVSESNGALEHNELGTAVGVEEILLTVVGVEHLPPSEDGDLDACVYAYQRDFEMFAPAETSGGAEVQTGTWGYSEKKLGCTDTVQVLPAVQSR
jgi:hypothetical protein